MSDEHEGTTPDEAGDAIPPTPTASSQDEVPAPPAPPAPAASGWSRPTGLPVLTLVLGAFLIGTVAFGIGLFAGRSSASGIDRGHGWMERGDARAPGSMMPGSGMPGAMLPGIGGSAPFPGMPGSGGVGTGAASGGWAVTAGTVTRVDGETIVVRSVRGNTVTVHTTDATSIRIVRDAGADGDRVQTGDEILVAGTPGDADLTIDAVRIIAGDLPWIDAVEGAASGSATSAN